MADETKYFLQLVTSGGRKIDGGSRHAPHLGWIPIWWVAYSIQSSNNAPTGSVGGKSPDRAARPRPISFTCPVHPMAAISDHMYSGQPLSGRMDRLLESGWSREMFRFTAAYVAAFQYFQRDFDDERGVSFQLEFDDIEYNTAEIPGSFLKAPPGRQPFTLKLIR